MGFTGVRYVAEDDILLSPNRGRASAVISMIVMGPSKEQTGDPVEFERYARELERLSEQHFVGRPHWGKMNWASRTTLEPAYGKVAMDLFLSIQSEMDPKGIFLNEYLNSRLGHHTASGASVP